MTLFPPFMMELISDSAHEIIILSHTELAFFSILVPIGATVRVHIHTHR